MMRNLKMTLTLLTLVFLLSGCTQPPLETNAYDPVLDQPGLKTVLISNERFAQYEDAKYRITSAVFEFNGVVAISLEIRNKTAVDLTAADYAISLTDGRDRQPVKMLSRADLVATKTKLAGGSGGNIQDQLIQATVDTLMNTLNTPTKEKLIRIVELGIKEYYSFRSIYAGDKRSGVLCFLPDFQLEYPLTLTVRLKAETVNIRFFPAKKQ